MNIPLYQVGLFAASLLIAMLFSDNENGLAIASSHTKNSDHVFPVLHPANTLSMVRFVRAASSLHSTLPEDVLDDRLAKLLQWVKNSYYQSGALHLLPDLADAINGAGVNNLRLNKLLKTYWLQDNALYGAAALTEFMPSVGKELSESWRVKWEMEFSRFCPDTQSSYVVGVLPVYDNSNRTVESRCRLPSPGTWQYFRMHQYPDPRSPSFDSSPLPIIGTDYPADEKGRTEFSNIRKTSARDLLKYGCLRQILLKHRDTALEMFHLALTQWDGFGFRNSKNNSNVATNLKGIYWTRELAFALVCANALGLNADDWGNNNVREADVEKQLWLAQSHSGGMWTNYCSGENCANDRIPAIAKQTNEIAPLVLLAYGKNIWQSSK